MCAAVVGKLLPGTLLAIVGLDLYTKGKGAEGMAKAAEKGGGGNPFDVGLMRNCTDFWTRGKTREFFKELQFVLSVLLKRAFLVFELWSGLVGVNYEAVWDIPPEGYRSVIAARRRSLASQKEAHSGRRGAGYEMLRTAEDAV